MESQTQKKSSLTNSPPGAHRRGWGQCRRSERATLLLVYKHKTFPAFWISSNLSEAAEDFWPCSVQFSPVTQLCLFAAPWTAACQASLSITNSWSLLKLMSVELMMPSNHLILCCPLLLLPSIFPRVFSNESILHIRWPKYWSFSFSISPSNEYSGQSSINPTYNYAGPGTGAKPSQSLSCNRVTAAEF